MVRREQWAEIRRLREREALLASELTRRFDLDRNTVRRCLNQAAFLRERAISPGLASPED